MALKQWLTELGNRARGEIDREGPGAPWLAVIAAFVFLIVIWIGYIIDAQGIIDVFVSVP